MRSGFNIKPSHTPLHGDGCRPVERVRQFRHEWVLTEFEWNPNTGEGACTYERTLPPECTPEPEVQTVTVVQAQPSGRWHNGWRMWNGRYTTEHT